MTDLKINDVRPRVYLEQTLAGAKVFDLPFPVVEAGDVKASVDGMPVPPEDFSVTKLGETDGARITFSDPPEVGARIAIWRDMPVERTADFLEDGAFRASSVNAELDRMAMLLQQIEAMLGDTIRRPVADADIDMRLPSRDVRAGTFLSFDAEGYPETVEKRESLNTVAENLTDIRNFADTYLGPQTSNPSTRSDGSALHDGDFYFNTADSRLRIYSSTSGSWVTGHAPVGDFLPRDGSLAMTGPLEAPAMTVDGNTVWHAGNDGPGSGLDADRLTGLESTDLARVADLQDAQARLAAAENQLALNTLRDLTAAGWSMSNMIDGFADSFEDHSGVSTNIPQNVNVAASVVPTTNESTQGGSLAGITDGSLVTSGSTYWQAAGAHDAGSWLVFDFGSPVAIGRIRNYHATNWSTIESAEVQSSDDGAGWSTEDTITFAPLSNDGWGEASFTPCGAHRYWRLYATELRNANNSNRPLVSEIEMFKVTLGDSVGETYDGAGAHFRPRANVQIDRTAGTAIGDMTGGGGNAAAFDGIFVQISTSGAMTPSLITECFVGKDFGAGNERVVNGARVHMPSDNDGAISQAATLNLTLYGANAPPADATDGTMIGSLGSVANGTTGEIRVATGLPNETAYRYAWIKLDTGGWNFQGYVAELELSANEPPDMTLISVAQTADKQPDMARVLLLAEPVGTITLNTDLIAEVSRDDGTSWTAGTLANAAHYEATTNVYVTDDIDLTAQPEGSVMRLRVRTTNAKEIRVHGWTLQWR